VGFPEWLTWKHLARHFTPDEAKAETQSVERGASQAGE